MKTTKRKSEDWFFRTDIPNGVVLVLVISVLAKLFKDHSNKVEQIPTVQHSGGFIYPH